jgi:hypothetical protein
MNAEIHERLFDVISTHLDVIRCKVLRRDDNFVQVGLHEFCDQVNLLEKVNVWRLKLQNEFMKRKFYPTGSWRCARNSISKRHFFSFLTSIFVQIHNHGRYSRNIFCGTQ